MTLALTLLYEMSQPDSTWQAFLALLPAKLPTPLFWNIKELEELRHSPISNRLEEHSRSIDAAHKAVFGPMQKIEPEVITESNFGLERFQWALSIVWSRSTYFTDEVPHKPARGVMLDTETCGVLGEACAGAAAFRGAV